MQARKLKPEIPASWPNDHRFPGINQKPIKPVQIYDHSVLEGSEIILTAHLNKKNKRGKWDKQTRRQTISSIITIQKWMPEIRYVGGKMQSNIWVQGRCAAVAWGFCNDLNTLRNCGERTKPKARIEYFDISTHITSLNAKWLYSLEYFNKSCGLKARDYCTSCVIQQAATLN